MSVPMRELTYVPLIGSCLGGITLLPDDAVNLPAVSHDKAATDSRVVRDVLCSNIYQISLYTVCVCISTFQRFGDSDTCTYFFNKHSLI